MFGVLRKNKGACLRLECCEQGRGAGNEVEDETEDVARQIRYIAGGGTACDRN